MGCEVCGSEETPEMHAVMGHVPAPDPLPNLHNCETEGCEEDDSDEYEDGMPDWDARNDDDKLDWR